MNQRRQAILVTFCVSESVALIISNVYNVFTKGNRRTDKVNERRAKNKGIRWRILQKTQTSNRSLDFLHFSLNVEN